MLSLKKTKKTDESKHEEVLSYDILSSLITRCTDRQQLATTCFLLVHAGGGGTDRCPDTTRFARHAAVAACVCPFSCTLKGRAGKRARHSSSSSLPPPPPPTQGGVITLAECQALLPNKWTICATLAIEELRDIPFTMREIKGFLHCLSLRETERGKVAGQTADLRSLLTH